MRLIVDLPSGTTAGELAPLRRALEALGLQMVQEGSVLRTRRVPTDSPTQRLREQDITPRPRTWPPTKEPTP
jgi:hypothetical protein